MIGFYWYGWAATSKVVPILESAPPHGKTKLQRFTNVSVPVKDKRTKPASIVFMDLPVLMPHFLVWALCEYYPQEFEDRIVGAPGVLQKY